LITTSLGLFSVLHLLPKAEFSKSVKCMCWFPSQESVGGEFWRSGSRPWNEKRRAQMVSLSMYFPRLNSLLTHSDVVLLTLLQRQQGFIWVYDIN